MRPRIGSLFSGYGGLDMGVTAAIGGSVAWHVEFDKAPSKILAHHWPDVPNYGDVTKTKWAPDCPTCGGSMAVYRKRAEGDPLNEFAGKPFYWCPPCEREWDVSIRHDDPDADRIPDPVDVITGGSPCQDLSHAGKRGGMTEGTRSNLWVAMREAIAQLRPQLVIWENVRGAYSAAAEGGPHDHELCLCGGSDRRGGVCASGHPEADLSSTSVDRDDRAGTGAAGGSARPVRGDFATTPQGDRSLGGGLDAGADRRPRSGSIDGDSPALAAQGTTGRSGIGRRGGADVAGNVALGSDLDARGASEVRGDQATDARSEQEGAACACPDCGGCVDATRCEVEPCAGCMGGAGDGQPSLRALGRVLGDLSDLGYDCRWHGLRAADVGAPHGRFRVFVIAHARREQWGQERRAHPLSGSPGVGEASGEPVRPATTSSTCSYCGEPRGAARCDNCDAGPLPLLPTPTSSDTNGAGVHGDGGLDLRTAVSLLPTPTTQDGANTGGPSQFDRNSVPLNALVTLLPTPAVNDMGEGKTPEARDEWTAKMQAAHGNGNGHGKSLAIEAQRLLPTPRAVDGTNVCGVTPNRTDEDNARAGITLHDISRDNKWGIYADAIARWESLTRPAPPPTQPSKKGTPQLSPAFSEWLMGLPKGHVTDVPGLSRNDQLKALGNGVVPQQCAAALRFLLSVRTAA